MNPHLTPWTVQPEAFPSDGFISDRLEFLLNYAILAPSAHNTQPWLFRINVSDVEIFADTRRALSVADPRRRELVIACGCALYNLRVAAHYFGQHDAVDVFPDPHQPNLLARLTLRGSAETASEDIVLFQAITERRTNREAFRPDPIAEEILVELAEASAAEGAWLAIVTDDQSRQAVAELVAKADRIQWASHDFRKELAAWIRTDAEHQADGIPTRELGFRDWMSFAGPALIRTFNRGDNQAARDAEIASHSPAIAVLGTYEDDPSSWLCAGQALESVLLHAQSEGLSVSHLNQPIEVADLRPDVGRIVDRSDFPQIILRLGYGPSVGPTPRRSVHSRLLMQDPSKAPPH
ncbi:MAG: nitroreductase family protein [Verrucomicrobiales bacterium]|nr:nitroreductase family protein [Verrucomicrobiales bacterium]